MQPSMMQRLFSQESRWAMLFLMFLSYFTVVHGFWNPPALFWDENYHIASAQKYLNGIFFMEPHPPLGKLVIALGEKLTHMNELDNQFIGTDYATNPPVGFSFFGYRLFPVLLAWLTVPVVFGIFQLLTRRTLWAVLFSFLFIFDNALMMHMRSAMLESTMLFFGALTIFAFLLAWEGRDDRKVFRNAALLFGFAFAGIMTTKAFGLILILLLPAMAWLLWPDVRKALRFAGWGLITFIVMYVGVWQIHFSVASKINPSLPDQGYYQASEEYKSLLATGRNRSLLFFPVMIRDSWHFVSHYEAGVPRLDLCKADENGSPWFFWPFGGRTINYRWETPDGFSYRYLYLVPNPAVWAAGLVGIVLSVVLLLSSVLSPGEQTKLRNRGLLLIFLGLYVSYMIAISRIDRVMYLYHYFLPLFFSFVLFGLVFMELKQLGGWKLSEQRKTAMLLGFSALVFAGFELMHPLSYYGPLTDEQFGRRSLLRIWDMKCVHCERNSPIVVPPNN